MTGIRIAPWIVLLAVANPLGAQSTAAIRYTGPAKPVRATEICRVTRVTDGDSIECQGIGRIRLIGIDAPELSQKPYGKLSGSELAKRIPVGTHIELEHDVQARDRNGRTLGYIWYRGELVNWWMVRQGWAITLTYSPDVQYVSWFAQAIKAARDDKLGLWAMDGFACEPYDHRHGHC